jgi:hypothetical protein
VRATGLSTYVGAHLVAYSERAIQWANNTKSIPLHAPAGIVVGGTVPVETPIAVEPLPATGQFRFASPTVRPNGKVSTLNTASPTTTADGLPTDVQVLALYSRGALSATVPADISGVAQYEGTAYTVDGIAVTKYMDVSSWIWKFDAASMLLLAQQHLDAIKDAEVTGSFTMLGEPTWDVLSFDYCVNFAISGSTSPWSGIDAPVRGVSIAWPQTHKASVSFQFSTARRPFSGDDLYTHPAFSGQSVLGGVGQNGGEMVAMVGGQVDYAGAIGMGAGSFGQDTTYEDFAAMGGDLGQSTEGDRQGDRMRRERREAMEQGAIRPNSTSQDSELRAKESSREVESRLAEDQAARRNNKRGLYRQQAAKEESDAYESTKAIEQQARRNENDYTDDRGFGPGE